MSPFRPNQFSTQDQNRSLKSYDDGEKFTHHKLRTIQFSNLHYDRNKQKRTCGCGQLLVFGYRPLIEKPLVLQSGNHCHVRYCPRCEWRKSMKQAAILYQTITSLGDSYEYVFLTLTQKNCAPEKLRAQLKLMSEAWNRMQLLKRNKSIKGYFRSMEITRGTDGTAHPHYHAILAVSKSYFKNNYWSQAKWGDEWQRVLKLDYVPIVDVRKVKDDEKTKSIAELIKYAVKDADIFNDRLWFEVIDQQTFGVRKYACGGVLKVKIVESPEPDEETAEPEQLFFQWQNDEYRQN